MTHDNQDAVAHTDAPVAEVEDKDMPTPKDVAEKSSEPSAEVEAQQKEEPADSVVEPDADVKNTADYAEDDDSDESSDDLDDLTMMRKALGRKNRDNQKLRERAKTAESQLLKYKVAMQLGLAPELVDRLRGDSEDELKADAEGLVKLLGARRGAIHKPDDGVKHKPIDNVESSLDEIGARIYRH